MSSAKHTKKTAGGHASSLNKGGAASPSNPAVHTPLRHTILAIASSTLACIAIVLFFSRTVHTPAATTNSGAHTLSASQTALTPPDITFDTVNDAGNKAGYIAHAFGEINGDLYTNSLEAFELNYARGYRLFECDFVYLKDGTVFIAHDGHEAKYGLTEPFPELTKEDIANVKEDGKYTPLVSKDIVSLMREHPDMILMLDTKMNHVDIITQLVKDAGNDPKILDRMVPHISDQANYDAVMSVYHFKYTMLALYRMLPLQPSNEDEIIDFIQKNNITAVMFNRKENDPTLAMINNGNRPGTFSFTKFHNKLQGARIPHYVHSVSSQSEEAKFRRLGVGVYMDIALPQ